MAGKAPAGRQAQRAADKMVPALSYLLPLLGPLHQSAPKGGADGAHPGNTMAFAFYAVTNMQKVFHLTTI